MIDRKKLDQIRPCVRKSLEQGADDDDEFKKMRQAIIYELNEIGIDKAEIKAEMLAWNNRNHKKLSLNKAKGELSGYVEWFFRHDCKLGCSALVNYCLYPGGGCGFQPMPHSALIPFPMARAESYLMSLKPVAYLETCLLKILYTIQQEKNVRIVFIGVRILAARVLNDFNHDLDLMSIHRALRQLEDIELIRIIPGRVGEHSGRANGYALNPTATVLLNNAITLMSNTLARADTESTHTLMSNKMGASA
jgi:hypothetical protein